MVITKLGQNKKEFLVDIFIDGEFFKTVDKNFIIESGLKKGQVISENDALDLENKGIINKLYNLCVNRILARPRSIYEIKQYLFKKEKRYDITSRVIEKLIKDGSLNDKEFCIWWIDNRNTFRAKSRLELESELKRKGVEGEVIKEVISENLNEELEYDNAKKIALKKIEELNRKSISPKEKREKLLQFLQRKGYNWDLILKIQGELI